MTTPDFTSVSEKTSRYRKVILAVENALVAVAVVERLKQEPMYKLSY